MQNDILKKLGKISLSGEDIYNALHKKTNIITYAQLRDYKSIDELLKPSGSIVILYETSKGFGHWVCLYKDGSKIVFFDPYGLKPDEELKFIPKHFRKENGTNYPLLTYLLYKSGKNIEYNNHRLQRSLKDANTCGRHCIVRILNKKIPLDKYAEILQNVKNITPDQVVTALTADVTE